SSTPLHRPHMLAPGVRTMTMKDFEAGWNSTAVGTNMRGAIFTNRKESATAKTQSVLTTGVAFAATIPTLGRLDPGGHNDRSNTNRTSHRSTILGTVTNPIDLR